MREWGFFSEHHQSQCSSLQHVKNIIESFQCAVAYVLANVVDHKQVKMGGMPVAKGCIASFTR